MRSIYVSCINDEGSEVYKLAEELQLGVEVLGFIEPFRISDFSEKVRITKDKLVKINNRSIHGPFLDLYAASRDPEVINVVKSRFVQAYKTAKLLDARNIVFHAGYIPKAFYPDDWIKQSTVFWRDFLYYVDENTEIHIENVCEDDYSLICRLVEFVDRPNFSVCLDIGHVNINSTKPIEEWIKRLNNKIKYVHLHNNDGISDSHFGLCRGNIDILRTLEMLEKYSPNAIWTLETKLNETEQSVLWLKTYGYIK